MAVKPILFSTPMVQAILRNEKTQTRRTKGLIGIPDNIVSIEPCGDGTFRMDSSSGSRTRVLSPKLPYSVGDILWVRETHAFANIYGAEIDAKEFHCKPNRTILYRADGPPWRYYTEGEVADFSEGPMGKMVPEYREMLMEPTWCPSIFMPRWAARIWLEVTAVRVERLQEITCQDAHAEGVGEPCPIPDCNVMGAHPFVALWDSINGSRKGCSWESNPFVGVYEFKRTEVKE